MAELRFRRIFATIGLGVTVFVLLLGPASQPQTGLLSSMEGWTALHGTALFVVAAMTLALFASFVMVMYYVTVSRVEMVAAGIIGSVFCIILWSPDGIAAGVGLLTFWLYAKTL